MNTDSGAHPVLDTDARSVDTDGHVSVHERGGVVAAYVGTNDELYNNFVDSGFLFWAVILSPIGIILLLSFMIERLSVASAASLYILFCFLQGLALSFIFQVYTTTSVVQVFFLTSGVFAAAGAIGYVTKRDFSSMGGILMLCLLGVIGGSLVNIFWANSALYWFVTYAGLAVFIALTVYDFNI
jgi:FtsH-binding integral membrane protein